MTKTTSDHGMTVSCHTAGVEDLSGEGNLSDIELGRRACPDYVRKEYEKL